MSSNNLLSALALGGAYVAGQALSKPSEAVSDAAALEDTIVSLRGNITALSSRLEATGSELSSQKEAYEALRTLYENSKADGGLTEELVMAYESTIKKISDRMAFLSDYLSAELKRSADGVSNHDIPKMPGLYIDPLTKFTRAVKDPSLYYGPNGDIRLHNVPAISLHPTLFYQAEGVTWTTAPMTHMNSANGTTKFTLDAEKSLRIQMSHPAALAYKDLGVAGSFVAAPSNYDADILERRFFDAWTLIEFDEDFDAVSFFDRVSLRSYTRYNDYGVPYGTFIDNPYHTESAIVIPLRSNVILTKSVGSTDGEYRGTWQLDFGLVANSPVEIAIKSVNAVYLPWHFSAFGGSTVKMAGKYSILPGPDLREYDEKMKVI